MRFSHVIGNAVFDKGCLEVEVGASVYMDRDGFWSLNVDEDVMSNEYRYKGDRAGCHVIVIMFRN